VIEELIPSEPEIEGEDESPELRLEPEDAEIGAESEQGGKTGKAKRGPGKRAFVDEIDDEILKAARKLLPKIPAMMEKNAANVLALRKAVESATKSYQGRKDRHNASKRDERRRRLVEEGLQPLGKVNLEVN